MSTLKRNLLICMILATVIGLMSCQSTGQIPDQIHFNPSPGSYIEDSEGVSSEIFLQDFQLTAGESEEQYFIYWDSGRKINTGETIFILSGTMRNDHEKNRYIAMYAIAYDEFGQIVSRTLDAAHTLGQILVSIENGDTGQFTMHLNTANNIDYVRIIARTYNLPPP